MNTAKFIQFLDCSIGSWVTQRTYHYLARQEVERSRTEFQIKPLSRDRKKQVLVDNEYLFQPDVEQLPGYNLGFYTISEKGEEVSQNLNILFVATKDSSSYLEGDYLRDRAYEEAQPIISHFRFDFNHQELLMTTNYTRVVAVDSITLINPSLRIRKIITYQHPQPEQPLENVVLVGFGVEQKLETER